MAERRNEMGEYVVTRHRPGNRLWLALLVLLLSAAAAAGGYFYGKAEQGFRWQQAENSEEQRERAEAELELLKQEYSDVSQRVVQLERGRSIDEQALNQARRSITELESEKSELEADLRFYRNIMAPSEASTGLQVERMSLEPVGNGEQYAFKLSLTKVGDNDRYISGMVAVNLIGDRNGEREVIALRDVSEDIEDLGVRFRFRYFQDVEGRLLLPDDFEPREVQVVAQSEGGTSTQAERSFDWATLTEN